MTLRDKQKPIVKEIIRARFEEVRRGRVNVFKNVALFIAYEIPGIEKKVMASIERHPALQDVHFSYELRVHIHDEFVECLKEQLPVIDAQLGRLSPTPQSITPGAGSPPDQRGGGAAATPAAAVNPQMQLTVDEQRWVRELLDGIVSMKYKALDEELMVPSKKLEILMNPMSYLKEVIEAIHNEIMSTRKMNGHTGLDSLQRMTEYVAEVLVEYRFEEQFLNKVKEVQQQEVKNLVVKLWYRIFEAKAGLFTAQLSDPLKKSEILEAPESHVEQVIEDIQKEFMAEWEKIYGAIIPYKPHVIQNYVDERISISDFKQKLLDKLKQFEKQQGKDDKAQVGELSSEQRGGGAAAPREAAVNPEMELTTQDKREIENQCQTIVNSLVKPIVLAETIQEWGLIFQGRVFDVEAAILCIQKKTMERFEEIYRSTVSDRFKLIKNYVDQLILANDLRKKISDERQKLKQLPLAHLTEWVQGGERPRRR